MPPLETEPTKTITPDAQARYAPPEDASLSRPGKKPADLSKKARVEPRPPNEPHTLNATSKIALPPGQRLAPVGREETEKVAIVQAVPKSVQPAQPAQGTDQGYCTGTVSSRQKGMCMHIGCLVKCVSAIMISFLPFSCCVKCR